MDPQGPPPPPPPPPPYFPPFPPVPPPQLRTHQNLLQSFPFTSEPTRETYRPWVSANAPTNRDLRIQTASLSHHLSEQGANFDAEVESQGRTPSATDARHARNLAELRVLWGSDVWWPAARFPPTTMPPTAKLCAAMLSLSREFRKHAPNQPLWDLWADGTAPAQQGFLTAAIRAWPGGRGRFQGDVVYQALRDLKAHFSAPALPPPPPAPAPAAPAAPAASAVSPAPPVPVPVQAQGRDQDQDQGQGEGQGEEEEEGRKEPESSGAAFGDDWSLSESLNLTVDFLPPAELPPAPTPSPPPPCYHSDSCSEVSMDGIISDYFTRPGVPAAPTTAKHRLRRLEALEAEYREQLGEDKKEKKEEAKKRALEARAAKPRVRPAKKAKMAKALAKAMVETFADEVETEFAGDVPAQRLEAMKKSLRVMNEKKLKELL
ncbi:hypothetical protein ColTof4_14358 [Colletotrichum tofieldiae]|nr:hypothetical protein ColTof3_14769 [Colletotrichum tofieldiae]GKT81935.1 hypothetical protein ColTof4_14358 [Colletotrichum tofieldiae]